MDTNEPRSREITRREALGWLGVGAAAGASDEVLRRIMVDKPATVSRIRPKAPAAVPRRLAGPRRTQSSGSTSCG